MTVIQQRKPLARRAFRGLAGSPLAVVETTVEPTVEPLVEPISVARRVLLGVSEPQNDPYTMEEWRTLHAGLLTQEDIIFEVVRKDTPNFRQMDTVMTEKGGLGEAEKRAMGQVKIERGTGSLHVIPVWFNNATAVRQFLTINFPYVGHHYYEETHTAAKWLFVIERWRANVKASRIAWEWNHRPHDVDPGVALLAELFGETTPIPRLDAKLVRGVVAKIRNVAAGLTQNGEVKAEKRGRPKRTSKEAA